MRTTGRRPPAEHSCQGGARLFPFTERDLFCVQTGWPVFFISFKVIMPAHLYPRFLQQLHGHHACTPLSLFPSSPSGSSCLRTSIDASFIAFMVVTLALLYHSMFSSSPSWSSCLHTFIAVSFTTFRVVMFGQRYPCFLDNHLGRHARAPWPGLTAPLSWLP